MKFRIFTFVCALSLSYFSMAQFKTNKVQELVEYIWGGEESNRVLELINLLNDFDSKLPGVSALEYDYWLAYLHYKIGISYLANDKEKAKEHFETGITLLNDLDVPNSETFALQGTLNSTMISIQSDKAWTLSQKAGELFNKALKYSEENPRAYLGLGKGDFYKPTQYGGGEKVEAHLKKAVSYYNAHEQSGKKGPTWGKEEVYYFLSAFYSKNNRLRDAKFYNNLGLKEFPKNKLLLAQKEKLY